MSESKLCPLFKWRCLEESCIGFQRTVSTYKDHFFNKEVHYDYSFCKVFNCELNVIETILKGDDSGSNAKPLDR